MTTYRIHAFDKVVDVASFRCGQALLDDYICRYASQDVRRNVARVFVATPESEPNRLAGFFTLSAGSVNCSELPQSLAKKLPRYPVPVALIGRLAVAVCDQRRIFLAKIALDLEIVFIGREKMRGRTPAFSRTDMCCIDHNN